MMSDGEYNVTFVDHKNTRIRGSVFISEDGFANIFINPRLDLERQMRTFAHEMVHLENDDAYNQDDIRIIEARANGRLPDPEANAVEDALLPEDFSVVARMRAWLWWGILPGDEIWVNFSRAYRAELIKDRCVGHWANRHKQPNPPHLSRLIRRLYAESFAVNTRRE